MANDVPSTEKPKPIYAFDIIEKIQHRVQFKLYPKGQRFLVGATVPEKTYLIKSGLFSISRQPDDILLWIAEGPAIRSMEPEQNIKFEYTIKVIAESEIAILDYDEFCKLLTEFNLWEKYARLLRFTILNIANHLTKISQSSVFEVVKKQLIELMSEPEQARLSITAESYIRNKTGLSRSAIMGILGNLKTGEYINTQRGILLSISRLPKNY